MAFRAKVAVGRLSTQAAILTPAALTTFVGLKQSQHGNDVRCETVGKEVTLRKRMTSIGRFTLRSETLSNPSVPTLFIALSGGGKSDSNQYGLDANQPSIGMTVPKFCDTFVSRDIHNLHPRYISRVSKSDDRYFDVMKLSAPEALSVIKNNASETLHTSVYRKDLADRIEKLLIKPIDVKEKLWELQISSGPLGSSGAIGQNLLPELLAAGKDIESVLLFRFHHALGDAASFAASFTDLFDEAFDIKSMIQNELQKRKKRRKRSGILKRLLTLVNKVIWLLVGTMRALLHHSYLLLTTKINPFLEVIPSSARAEGGVGRSISWGTIAPVDEVKHVAKIIGGDKKVTLNDVLVSCISQAVARQLAEHRERYAHNMPENRDKLYQNLNVVIPVHLTGGILLPGTEIGNKLGAFVAQVPGEKGDLSASERLMSVHESLYTMKRSAMPYLSHFVAKLVSTWLPKTLASTLLERSSANASFVVTNARGFEKKVHINGHRVEAMAGFIPLPPGIPVGIVVQTYGSEVIVSVSGEKECLPDPDKFLQWIVDEYKLLCKEASLSLSST